MYGDFEDQGLDYQRFLPQQEDASNAIFNRGNGLLPPVKRKAKSFLNSTGTSEAAPSSGGGFFSGIRRAFSI